MAAVAHVSRGWPAAAPRTPGATYRIQFGPNLGFAAARRLVPFLDGIGITDVYASPVFKACPASRHGYDIVDPGRLNPCLGTEAEFKAFAREIRSRGMGLILDIVPNHMAANSENPWWRDVLEEGPGSPFARYFDIDWVASAGRLLLPVLGDSYENALARGELKVGFDRTGMCVRYWEHWFPLSPQSYPALLEGVPGCAATLAGIDNLPQTAVAAEARLTFKRAIKRRLWSLYLVDEAVREGIHARLDELNHSPERLDAILRTQAYELDYWYTGRDRIRYRRFFDVNSLVGVRVEDPDVFRATHGLVLRLVRDGLVTGLRIDHIDGLRDPHAYLRLLRRELDRVSPEGVYITAEKVLLHGETLPPGWKIAGTTGYDFLDAANGVFVNSRALPRLGEIYARFTGISESFEDLVYAQKKRVVRHLFSAELSQLADRLQVLSSGECQTDDLAAVIEEVTACLGVYRTYVRSCAIANTDREAIEQAFGHAIRRAPSLPRPALSVLRRVLLLALPERCSRDLRAEWLDLVERWQQFTGPVMAKGLEDTAYYIYNRLISLNVIGGGCHALSARQYHAFNTARQRRWSGSLNATSTHDTKRSEDVRARLNVLSEIPDTWERSVARWSEWNRSAKRLVHGAAAPSANDEFLLYQVLLGAWPLRESDLPEFRRRIREFAVKAAREAKTHTDWLRPDSEYEEALLSFLDRILEPDNPFLADFLRLQGYLAPFGALASLAQVVLKTTAPGVPDFYQGTMLWDFSLVDPDNRRPVDFGSRLRLWRDLPGAAPDELLKHWRDGRVKMFTTAKLLNYRREHRELFEAGEYIPLQARGPAAEHVLAYARCMGGRWAVTAVPRMLAVAAPDCSPLDHASVWRGTTLNLPAEAPGGWRHVFTGEPLWGRTLRLENVFASYPVAVLGAHRL